MLRHEDEFKRSYPVYADFLSRYIEDERYLEDIPPEEILSGLSNTRSRSSYITAIKTYLIDINKKDDINAIVLFDALSRSEKKCCNNYFKTWTEIEKLISKSNITSFESVTACYALEWLCIKKKDIPKIKLTDLNGNKLKVNDNIMILEDDVARFLNEYKSSDGIYVQGLKGLTYKPYTQDTLIRNTSDCSININAINNLKKYVSGNEYEKLKNNNVKVSGFFHKVLRKELEMNREIKTNEYAKIKKVYDVNYTMKEYLRYKEYVSE